MVSGTDSEVRLQTSDHSNNLNKGEDLCQSLPVIAVTNARSLLPKVKSVIQEIKESEIDLLFVNEVLRRRLGMDSISLLKV